MMRRNISILENQDNYSARCIIQEELQKIAVTIYNEKELISKFVESIKSLKELNPVEDDGGYNEKNLPEIHPSIVVDTPNMVVFQMIDSPLIVRMAFRAVNDRICSILRHTECVSSLPALLEVTTDYSDDKYLACIICRFKNEDSLEESIIMDKDDIYYSKDKFDRGDINLCFITGFSGSGKTTMSKNMGKCRVIELDFVQAGATKFTIEDCKKQDDMIYSFFTGVGTEFWVKDRDFSWQENSFAPALINTFIDYAIDYSKSHKNQKFVIEGVQLFAFVEPEKVKDYAVYIKGTGAIKSLYRGCRRDALKKKDKENVAYGTARRMKDRAQYVPGNVKLMNKWIEYYGNLAVE